MICQACRNYPGNGIMCPVAHVHATAARRRCGHFLQARGADHVVALRRMALSELRRGDLRRYAALLNVAHKTREAMQ